MLNKIFFETKMTWKRVIILSILCGIIPGLLMVPRILINTSFQQPGITFEFWIVMAMYIILNCGSPLEAGKKTFIFFLISQPLIYLVQVPFSWLHWYIFIYYPKWGIITLLTFPGAMLAWYTKQNKWYSIAILMVASGLQCIHLISFCDHLIHYFPQQILSALFTLGSLILFPYLLFKKKSYCLISYGCIILMMIAFLQAYYRPQELLSGIYSELNEKGPYTLVECDDVLEVEFDDQALLVRYDLRKMIDQQYYYIEFIDGEEIKHHYTYQYQENCLVFIEEE